MKSNEEKMKSVFGKAEAAPDIDWKARAEAAEKKLHDNEVERGRVKQLSGELAEARSRLAEWEAKDRSKAMFQGVSEDERNAIPDEVLSVTGKVAGNALEEAKKQMLAEVEARFAKERSSRSRMDVESRVNAYCPTFFNDVNEGGDKCDAWKEYRRYNNASIAGAFEDGDFDTLKYHIDSFYNQKLGIPVPSGEGGTAAPDPRSHGGGQGVQTAQGKVYTNDEYIALYDEIEKCRSRGDFGEMRRLEAELKKAPAEGRVK